MSRILKKEIDDCIASCTRYIEESLRHVNDDTGWHQHLGTKKIGIVATAMVLLYYQKLGKTCPDKNDCIDFIKRKVNDDGGWPYISNTHGKSNVESTCWALTALHSYAPDESHQIIEKGLKWLLDQYKDLKYRDNGWSFADESSPRIYITSFVLRTLTKLGKSDIQEFESAKKWIMDSQNGDGGWGELPDKGSSIFFTCYVINTLLECGFDENDRIIRKAKTWLDLKIQGLSPSDPSLLCYLEFIESGTGADRIRIPFFHYVSPYILMTYSFLDRKSPQLFKALEANIRNCEDGIVEHPMLENSRIVPVWALYDTVVGLEDWKESGWNWDDTYQFSVFLYKIRSFGKWNLLGYMVSAKQWILNGVVLIAVLTPILCFYEKINNWLGICSVKWWGQLLISFGASCIYGLVMYLFNRLRKKLP